jgi:hypothetical protein
MNVRMAVEKGQGYICKKCALTMRFGWQGRQLKILMLLLLMLVHL